MKPRYRVEWLRPQHARAVAQLERAVYPPLYRAGRASILEDLQQAEREHANISMGLFYGRRLVGVFLCFLERERRRICEYLQIPPPDCDLSGPGVYINDFIVHPRHRGAGKLLGTRMALFASAHPDIRNLPAHAISTTALADVWQAKSRYLARFGLKLVERRALQAQAHEPLYWLTFQQEHVHIDAPALATALKERKTLSASLETEIAYIDDYHAWPALQPYWNKLVQATPGSTIFQTYEYLHLWWQHFGCKNDLFLVIVLERGEPVVIAPMQITPMPWLGKFDSCLSFLGHPSEVDRNTLIGPRHAAFAGDVAQYLLALRERWNSAALYEQQPENAFLHAFTSHLRRAGYLVDCVPGPECARVTIEGSWPDYLAHKPKTLRKSLKRKQVELARAGTIAFQSVTAAAELSRAYLQYELIEAKSWKPASGLGIGKSSAHFSFYHELVREFGRRGGAEFHFLCINGVPMAGTFGLIWDGTYYSLHIAHDDSARSLSPGVMLTAFELERAFVNHPFDVYDFLGGFMTNKRTWATNVTPTEALFAHTADLRGRLFHAWYFHARPAIRSLLVRVNLLEQALYFTKRLRRFLHERGLSV